MSLWNKLESTLNQLQQVTNDNFEELFNEFSNVLGKMITENRLYHSKILKMILDTFEETKGHLNNKYQLMLEGIKPLIQNLYFEKSFKETSSSLDTLHETLIYLATKNEVISYDKIKQYLIRDDMKLISIAFNDLVELKIFENLGNNEYKLTDYGKKFKVEIFSYAINKVSSFKIYILENFTTLPKTLINYHKFSTVLIGINNNQISMRHHDMNSVKYLSKKDPIKDIERFFNDLDIILGERVQEDFTDVDDYENTDSLYNEEKKYKVLKKEYSLVKNVFPVIKQEFKELQS